MSSLLNTVEDCEIIVVDNGGSLEDSKWLLGLTNDGHIASYTRFRKNMHFWYARNLALTIATGKYIVIMDNDIQFTHLGWLQECIAFLDKNKGKYLATPINADPMNSIRKDRWVGEVGGWKLNSRAGSNCWVMRREDYEIIGNFDQHRIAGSKWADRYTRLGYTMACMPQPKAIDLCFRKGYNISMPINNLTL